jgi:hypothetical protein
MRMKPVGVVVVTDATISYMEIDSCQCRRKVSREALPKKRGAGGLGFPRESMVLWVMVHPDSPRNR